MDRRKNRRLETRQFAWVGGKPAVLNDISNHGFKVSTALNPANDRLAITFNSDSEPIVMEGLIKWITRRDASHLLNTLGVHIENPPETYSKFVHNRENDPFWAFINPNSDH